MAVKLKKLHSVSISLFVYFQHQTPSIVKSLQNCNYRLIKIWQVFKVTQYTSKGSQCQQLKLQNLMKLNPISKLLTIGKDQIILMFNKQDASEKREKNIKTFESHKAKFSPLNISATRVSLILMTKKWLSAKIIFVFKIYSLD